MAGEAAPWANTNVLSCVLTLSSLQLRIEGRKGRVGTRFSIVSPYLDKQGRGLRCSCHRPHEKAARATSLMACGTASRTLSCAFLPCARRAELPSFCSQATVYSWQGRCQDQISCDNTSRPRRERGPASFSISNVSLHASLQPLPALRNGIHRVKPSLSTFALAVSSQSGRSQSQPSRGFEDQR